MTWRTARLGDFIKLQRGHDLPSQHREDGIIPVVSSSGVTGYHNKAKAAAPGVVTGRYGTLGEVFFLNEDYWPLNTALYVTDFKGNDPKFAAYFLKNVLKDYQSDKAAVPGIDRNVLHELKVRAPDLPVQLGISSILSAYDDLIANNRRRIKLLEDSVRLVFDEWFVALKFPGRVRKLSEDDLPDGWSRRPLAEVCESIDYGYTASANHENVGPKFLRITDIVPDVLDWGGVPHCEIENDRLDKFKLIEGDIVIARTGATVGYAKRINKRHPDAVFASYLVRLRIKPSTDNLMVGVYVESEKYKSYIQANAGGAAQPNANAKVLTSADILLPPYSLQLEFRKVVEPLIDQREVLQLQIRQLCAARDLLLPRLMSGELVV